MATVKKNIPKLTVIEKNPGSFRGCIDDLTIVVAIATENKIISGLLGSYFEESFSKDRTGNLSLLCCKIIKRTIKTAQKHLERQKQKE